MSNLEERSRLIGGAFLFGTGPFFLEWPIGKHVFSRMAVLDLPWNLN
jgi:hypothetical protein